MAVSIFDLLRTLGVAPRPDPTATVDPAMMATLVNNPMVAGQTPALAAPPDQNVTFQPSLAGGAQITAPGPQPVDDVTVMGQANPQVLTHDVLAPIQAPPSDSLPSAPGVVRPWDPVARGQSQDAYLKQTAWMPDVPDLQQGPGNVQLDAKRGWFDNSLSPAQRWMMLGATLKDLGGIGLGQEPGHVEALTDKYRTQNIIAAQMGQRQALINAGAFNGDPVAQYGFMWDPEAFDKQIAERYGPQNAREGSTISYGPGGVGGVPNPTYAPKYGIHGDIPYAQTGANVATGNALPQTPQEMAEMANASAHQAEAKAAWERALAEGRISMRRNESLAYFDQNGHPVYHDAYTGQDRVGDIAFGQAKSGGSAFQQKIALLTRNGMSEMDAAKMAMGKTMTAEQINQQAITDANHRIQNGEGAGDPAAFERFRQEAVQTLSASNDLPLNGTPGSNAPPQTPPPSSATARPTPKAISVLKAAKAKGDTATVQAFDQQFGQGASDFYGK